MAVVNMNNLLNGKDSRWLQLEVCREYQRNKCSRPDTDCKFAHPAANVEVQNGRVTACYDSIKVSKFYTYSPRIAFGFNRLAASVKHAATALPTLSADLSFFRARIMTLKDHRTLYKTSPIPRVFVIVNGPKSNLLTYTDNVKVLTRSLYVCACSCFVFSSGTPPPVRYALPLSRFPVSFLPKTSPTPCIRAVLRWKNYCWMLCDQKIASRVSNVIKIEQRTPNVPKFRSTVMFNKSRHNHMS